MSEARKIAVIVALDVAGYSARTEADEAKTTAEVAALRNVIETIAARHGGRVFNTAGDGFMLEFSSSLAAVEAAFELAETCDPKVRVGVHLGDVVVQPNGDLLGHGVNVAARLMAQAAPGSMLVSADVRRTIRGPIAERLVSRGLLQLDKMAETIEAFTLGAMTRVAAASMQRSEPVLAVLPFDNQSNDPEMVFFSDGVSEEVLQIVARAQGIRVIGKGSSFQFRGDNKSVRKVAQELRASHVLDGSVRRAGDQIRVAAHLVEAASQMTLWTERFDRKLSDVFALQDEIAGTIASKLQAQISLRNRRPVDPGAYDLYLRARKDQTEQWAPDLMKTTELLLEQAVAIAPDFAAAWGFLSVVRGIQIPPFYDSDGSPEHAAVLAAARRALSLDPDCADAVWASNSVLPAFSAYEKKLENTLHASTLAPSDASILSNRAFSLTSVGYCREALAVHRRQAEIDPRLRWAQAQFATALMSVGQIDEGLRLLNAAHAQDYQNVWIPLTRSIVLAYLAARDESRMEEALASLDAPLPDSISTTPLGVGVARIRAVLKEMLLLRGKGSAEREAAIADLLTSSPLHIVSIVHCHVAAALGHASFALRLLHEALDKNFPILGGGGGRSNTTMAFFGFPASPLRSDPAFAKLCARLGLAQFWMSSGKWPDCAADVPYDFKRECEKALLEIAKA